MRKSGQSLWQHYPNRIDVLFYIVGCIALLLVAQATPVLAIKKFVFWKSQYSLFSGTLGLFRSGHYGLGAVLFFFSIVFPFAKLLILATLWAYPFTNAQRRKVLAWLELLGRWSMLDVFVVALIVVIAKSGGALEASPKLGIYLFAAAVILSMVLTLYMHHLARQIDPKIDKV